MNTILNNIKKLYNNNKSKNISQIINEDKTNILNKKFNISNQKLYIPEKFKLYSNYCKDLVKRNPTFLDTHSLGICSIWN